MSEYALKDIWPSLLGLLSCGGRSLALSMIGAVNGAVRHSALITVALFEA
jgi:hypothetical protein